MKQRYKSGKFLALTVLICLGFLGGCGKQTVTVPTQSPMLTGSPVPTPEPTPTPMLQSEEPLTVSDKERIKAELLAAMEDLRQPRVMERSDDLELSELDVKNIYYEILAERPELKCTYDLTVTIEVGALNCRLFYMPYKTGAFPADFTGEEVSSLHELLALAEAHLGEEEAPLCITDPTLEPDEMNRALQQVGGGYIYCALSRDGAALQYSPPAEMTLEDCMEALALADGLADQVVEELITDGMTQREKAQALYAFLTVNVAYDQRYYSDKANMPYASQTALGALEDHTAICGGYANALKILYEKIGIPCYIVSGKYFQEYHAWNVALVEGEWLWFDATTDRGSTGEFGFLRFALTELDGTKYYYEEEAVRALTAP